MLLLTFDFITQCSSCPSVATTVTNVPYEGDAMKRKISWSLPAEGTSYSTSKISCCFDTECDTQESDGSASYGFDFNKLIFDSLSAAPKDRMAFFAKNNYTCTVTLCNGVRCTDPSSAAEIQCPSGELASPSQITGDPSSDGWFYIGNSKSVGTYVRTTAGQVFDFDVFVTSFTWNSSVVTSSAIKGSYTFGTGEAVIGLGLVVNEGNINPGNIGFKLDLTGEGPYKPATAVESPSDDGFGSFVCVVGNMLVDYTALDVYQSCPSKTIIDDPFPPKGNFYQDNNNNAFEFVFGAEELVTLGAAGVDFSNGWKVIIFGAENSSGLQQVDTIAFGLPYCNGN